MMINLGGLGGVTCLEGLEETRANFVDDPGAGDDELVIALRAMSEQDQRSAVLLLGLLVPESCFEGDSVLWLRGKVEAMRVQLGDMVKPLEDLIELLDVIGTLDTPSMQGLSVALSSGFTRKRGES